MQKIKRLEAGDSSQARGMDTQAMLPVLAMVAELTAMLGFRWVSVPDLRYSPYAQAGMLWKLEETAKGIAWNYQVPEAMTRAADQAAGYLRIGMAVSVILGLCFILQAFRVKVKAKRLGRLAFLWNTGMTAARRPVFFQVWYYNLPIQKFIFTQSQQCPFIFCQFFILAQH